MKKILWKIESLWEGCYTPTPAGIDVSAQYSDGASENWPSLVQRDVLNTDLSEKPVFQDDYGTYRGLAQHQLLNVDGKPLYIFDNHNLALVALYELKESSSQVYPLVHIDAHRDDATFEGDLEIASQDLNDEQTEYRQSGLDPESTLQNLIEQSRISDFLDAAQKTNLTSDIIRVVSTEQFENFTPPTEPYILTVDIDIFGPEGAHVDLETKVRTIAQAWSGASAIICATSPGFIDQEFALEIIKIFIK